MVCSFFLQINVPIYIVHSPVKYLSCEVTLAFRFGRFGDFGDFLRKSNITQYIHITDT